ncbi:MAG: alpha/beta fold hydrolase [Candidatus Thorarchaeota archaeon]|nr:alpha/beta fold hydrolase [Candidatus Thorarchaeota archaeon]
MMHLQLRYTILVISIGMLLGGAALGASTQAGFGVVSVVETDFLAGDGALIHSTLQTPTYASAANRLPGVLVIHGSLQSKEWLMAFGIELARRGFVVLTIDANGHGNSDKGTSGGTAALEYLAALSTVDASQIGIVGHSMGGGIALRAINESSTVVNALVLVGSGVGRYSNTTYPRNLMVAVGDFDSLSAYPSNTTLLSSVFGVPQPQPGVLYGDFGTGSARKLVLSDTNHLFETIDPVIISATIEWMKDSLKGGVEDSHWTPSSQTIYGWWLLGGLVSTAGAVLSVFPLLTILIRTKWFGQLRREPEYVNAASRRQYLRAGTLYGLISVIGFYPLLAVGTMVQLVVPFPQYQGLPVLFWIAGTAVISLLALPVILRDREEPGRVWRELREVVPGQKDGMRPILMTFLLALTVVAWLYAWTLIVDLSTSLDLRCFLPGMNDLTLSRALIAPIYAAVFFLYFLVEGMWLMGAMRTRARTGWIQGQLAWSVEAVFIKCIPFALLILLEFGGGLLLSVAIVPGIAGYSFLFFYAFLPWFAVSSVLTVWCYRETGSYYLAAMVNAMLFGWLMATILAF